MTVETERLQAVRDALKSERTGDRETVVLARIADANGRAMTATLTDYGKGAEYIRASVVKAKAGQAFANALTRVEQAIADGAQPDTKDAKLVKAGPKTDTASLTVSELAELVGAYLAHADSDARERFATLVRDASERFDARQ